jgi:hypothetical protein
MKDGDTVYVGTYKHPKRKKLKYSMAFNIMELPMFLVDGLIVYLQYGVSRAKLIKTPDGFTYNMSIRRRHATSQ